jgi:MoaA/NifB/PqqE/SkfB family radical SAM enzyme
LLRVLEMCEKAKIRLQGPSLAFDSSSLARRIAALPGLEWVATTLQSSDPDEHDAMVGAKGAQVRLLKALDNLAMLEVRVVLSVVLTRRAVRSLPKTFEFLKERGWRVELASFVPDRSMQQFQDKLVPLDELRLALENAGAVTQDVVTSLVGVPFCAVPEALRAKIAPALETRERDPLQLGLVCRTCTRQATCSGIVAGYMHAFGERGLTAL